MKKLNPLQDYLIRKLIEDELLNVDNLMIAINEICSEEQFKNILNRLISSNDQYKQKNRESEKQMVLVDISTFPNKELESSNKIDVIEILKQYYDINLCEAKELIDAMYKGGVTRIPIPIELEKANALLYELKKRNIHVSIYNATYV